MMTIMKVMNQNFSEKFFKTSLKQKYFLWTLRKSESIYPVTKIYENTSTLFVSVINFLISSQTIISFTFSQFTYELKKKILQMFFIIFLANLLSLHNLVMITKPFKRHQSFDNLSMFLNLNFIASDVV